MGIPIYYRRIIDKYPECVNDVQGNVDNLLLDFNSFIYNVIPSLDISLNAKDFENVLITETINQLIQLINMVKPTKLLYIAMDGPPPKAKMIQQRSRRYKSLKENEFIKELEKKYKIKIDMCKWNKNAISPGTVFMSKLSKQIIKAIGLLPNNYEIIFSNDLVAGEGEHKLMPFLKENMTNVIYSPDADMIVLSVLSGISEIFILRYSESLYTYLNINILRSKIIASFDKSVDAYRILKDYSFLTFLCGNDFVHAVSFLKIKDNGLDILINIYSDSFKKHNTYLIDANNKINNMFLLDIVNVLKDLEPDKLKTIQKKRHHTMKKNPNVLKTTELDKEPWQVEFSRFQHEEYYSPLNPKYNPNIYNRINYYDSDWVNQYNKFFFKDLNIDEVQMEYYKSLQFCTDYYFSKNISWNYFYKYITSPNMNDFCNYLKANINISVSLDPGKPYKPFEQLLMILPKSSHNLLPKCLRSSEKDSKFELDIMQGTKFIYSEVLLPEIEDEKIINLVKSCDFSIDEIKRNTLITTFVSLPTGRRVQ